MNEPKFDIKLEKLEHGTVQLHPISTIPLHILDSISASASRTFYAVQMTEGLLVYLQAYIQQQLTNLALQGELVFYTQTNSWETPRKLIYTKENKSLNGLNYILSTCPYTERYCYLSIGPHFPQDLLDYIQENIDSNYKFYDSSKLLGKATEEIIKEELNNIYILNGKYIWDNSSQLEEDFEWE